MTLPASSSVPGLADVSLSVRLRALLDAGRVDEARDLLRAARPDDPGDADEHRALGGLAEVVGDVGLALVQYNLSLRDRLDQPDVLLRIARLRADRGEVDRAVRAYARFLSMRPDAADVREEAEEFLADCGRSELLPALSGVRPAGQDSGAPADAPEGPQPSGIDLAPTDSDCVLFASVFAGREGVHARQWSGPEGRTGYSPVREPFTPAVARQHLLGAITVGIYPLRMDGTVCFLALDVDVARAAPGSPASAEPFERRLRAAHGVARAIADAAAATDLPCLLEDSGHKGRHVWILFERPVPAAAARRLADSLIERAGRLPPGISIEVFPRQSRVAAGGLGNLIKLPLGVHRLTGRRCLLLDPASGHPIEQPMQLLADLPRVSRETLRGLVQTAASATGPRLWDASARDSEDEPGNVSSDEEAEEDVASGRVQGPSSSISMPARGTSPLPEEAPYDPARDVPLQAMLARCPVLADVVTRVQASGLLSTDERVVLTHTIGHLPDGPRAVNHLLTRALNCDPSTFLRSRLRGSPASCPRIRARLPLVTAAVSCTCSFDAASGLYPTPVLYANAAQAPVPMSTPSARTPVAPDRLVADLVRARAQLAAARAVAERVEAAIAQYLSSPDAPRTLETVLGTARREGDAIVIEPPPSGEAPCRSST